MNSLKQQLTRSLHELGVRPVLVQPRLPDRRYAELHQKRAAGTILPDELAELDLMQAMKIEEAGE
jgi:hypothetical protein